MLEILFIITLGVLTGIFTGLTPGIHPNTVIFGSMPFYFATDIGFFSYMVFVSGLSVAHTFHDFLPAIFLGAPQAESALSAIPGGEMAAEGRGLEAFYYTVTGGMWSVVLFLIFSPLLYFLVEPFYELAEGSMEYMLLFLLLVLVLDSDNVPAAFLVAILAGLLGTLSFSSMLNRQYILVPVFAGLFAFPSVMVSLKQSSELPRQRPARVDGEKTLKGGLTGFLAGLTAGVFPGLGAAAATSLIAPMMDSSQEEFLAGMGGVNTTDILMSFLSILLIEKARSGASVALKAVSEVTKTDVFFLMGASLFATGLSVILSVRVSKLFLKFSRAFDFRNLLIGVLVVITFVTVYLTGLRGIMVLLTSWFIGTAAVFSGNRKICMAVLLVPAILFFSNIGV